MNTTATHHMRDVRVVVRDTDFGVGRRVLHAQSEERRPTLHTLTRNTHATHTRHTNARARTYLHAPTHTHTHTRARAHTHTHKKTGRRMLRDLGPAWAHDFYPETDPPPPAAGGGGGGGGGNYDHALVAELG